MGELGLLGVPWSEELGGAGMDQLSYYITIHEMAKVDASHALTISAHTNLGTSPIVEFGTEEQKRRYVPLLASRPGARRLRAHRAGRGQRRRRHRHHRGGQGRPLPAQRLQDLHHPRRRRRDLRRSPRAPSRAAATRGSPASSSPRTRWTSTSAARLGVGHAADLPKTQGVRAGKKEDKMGWRASDTRELIFEDAVVPKENLLGQAGLGLHQLPEDARRRPHRDRRALARHRGGRLRGGAAVRRRPEAVRPAASGASRA